MAFRKSSTEARPQIAGVSPLAAIPGGEFTIRGKGLANGGVSNFTRAQVRFGNVAAPIVIGSDSFVIARVPEGAAGSEMTVGGESHSSPWTCEIGIPIAEGLHPVSNPVVD